VLGLGSGYEKHWEWPGPARLEKKPRTVNTKHQRPETQTAAASYAGSNAASMTNYYTQSRDW